MPEVTRGEEMGLSKNKKDVFSVGLDGLGVTCSPRDPRFAGSNSTEVDGYFRT